MQNPTNWEENSEKSDFSQKQFKVVKSFSLQLVAQVTIVENTKNSQKSLQQNW